jgi:glycosyltransferase involved in cell wall biosynthesis
LYAGDLDPKTAERLLAVGRAVGKGKLPDTRLLVAARPKGARDQEARAALESGLAAEIAGGIVELHGEVSDMNALLRRATLQLYVADHVRAKVDLPLVLLEGLARGVGLVALDFAPLNEIFERAERHGLGIGARVPDAIDSTPLLTALQRLLDDDQSLQQIQSDARRLIELEFSLPAVAARYEALYAALDDARAC